MSKRVHQVTKQRVGTSLQLDSKNFTLKFVRRTFQVFNLMTLAQIKTTLNEQLKHIWKHQNFELYGHTKRMKVFHYDESQVKIEQFLERYQGTVIPLGSTNPIEIDAEDVYTLLDKAGTLKDCSRLCSDAIFVIDHKTEVGHTHVFSEREYMQKKNPPKFQTNSQKQQLVNSFGSTTSSRQSIMPSSRPTNNLGQLNPNFVKERPASSSIGPSTGNFNVNAMMEGKSESNTQPMSSSSSIRQAVDRLARSGGSATHQVTSHQEELDIESQSVQIEPSARKVVARTSFYSLTQQRNSEAETNVGSGKSNLTEILEIEDRPTEPRKTIREEKESTELLRRTTIEPEGATISITDKLKSPNRQSVDVTDTKGGVWSAEREIRNGTPVLGKLRPSQELRLFKKPETSSKAVSEANLHYPTALQQPGLDVVSLSDTSSVERAPIPLAPAAHRITNYFRSESLYPEVWENNDQGVKVEYEPQAVQNDNISLSQLLEGAPNRASNGEKLPLGMINLGNTCYSNSVVQVLIRLASVQKELKKYTPEAIAETQNEASNHKPIGPITHELLKLMEANQTPECSRSFDGSDLKSAIDTKAPQVSCR